MMGMGRMGGMYGYENGCERVSSGYVEKVKALDSVPWVDIWIWKLGVCSRC